ncbi:integrase [Streptomyces sp. NPDC058371]|uniref:integrase n=1 Tax=Streptomyces sp. NPDC058371 TaxID=3346463 RepID=UPI0036615E08
MAASRATNRIYGHTSTSVKTVSECLGPTNAAMTPNIYTHLRPDSEERTRAAVDKAYADQSADAQPQVYEAA